jgi:hypothetical protein
MASSEDSLPALKILIVGPSGAGKSACESASSVPTVTDHLHHYHHHVMLNCFQLIADLSCDHTVLLRCKDPILGSSGPLMPPTI